MSSTSLEPPAPREHPEPPVPVQCREFIVLHPAFKQATIIFRWYASAIGPGRVTEAPETYAFPCDIATEACVIVARNKRGQLYHQEDGSIGQKVKTAMILPGMYYFLLDDRDSSYKYKVYWDFQYWIPPEVIPSPWLLDNRTDGTGDFPVELGPGKSGASAIVRDRDKACVMTSETDFRRLDSAHLIPVKEEAWYATYQLKMLAADSKSVSVNSFNNLIVLRHDLNGRGLDSGDFCFVPYQGVWISLWMGQGSLGLASQHNFAKVELPRRIRARYLHCRFAWNVFQLIHELLSSLLSTNLAPLLDNGTGSDGGDEAQGKGKEKDAKNSEDKEAGPGPTTRSRAQKSQGGSGGKAK
ncbi:C6 transcription factor [Mycena sanguinolenta]|uniref:C6 transcription factor n=1 Tax=Mycena sanguinolenta TaxID=230812 RepID=A0A8H6YXS9_9AGAR|nr:C6 transcription factor [Mycena sanguinolenta]